jgi:hypothetical protein
MRILFDQGTPVPLRSFLPGHTVTTAAEQGWSTLLNGELLRAAEQAGFDVLITTYTSLPCQQDLPGRQFAVVVVSKNRWKLIREAILEVTSAIAEAKPGTHVVVEIPND